MNYSVFVQEYVRAALRQPGQFRRRRGRAVCTVCGFEGKFLDVGPRPQARCPNCSSKERDRIMGLYLARAGIEVEGRAVLHFSPERPFFRRWKDNPNYVAGDIKPNKLANAMVDVTAIQFPDEHFDVVICHHVLEHVPDDARGMRECFRVLKAGGTAFFSVPLHEGREETWEPPAGMPPEEVDRICGRDHVRLYGRDFPLKLQAAGFAVDEIRFTAEEGERHRLAERHALAFQGLDRVFVCTKPQARPA